MQCAKSLCLLRSGPAWQVHHLIQATLTPDDRVACALLSRAIPSVLSPCASHVHASSVSSWLHEDLLVPFLSASAFHVPGFLCVLRVFLVPRVSFLPACLHTVCWMFPWSVSLRTRGIVSCHLCSTSTVRVRPFAADVRPVVQGCAVRCKRRTFLGMVLARVSSFHQRLELVHGTAHVEQDHVRTTQRRSHVQRCTNERCFASTTSCEKDVLFRRRLQTLLPKTTFRSNWVTCRKHGGIWLGLPSRPRVPDESHLRRIDRTSMEKRTIYDVRCTVSIDVEASMARERTIRNETYPPAEHRCRSTRMVRSRFPEDRTWQPPSV